MSYPNLDKFTIVRQVSKKVFYTLYDAVDRKTEQQLLMIDEQSRAKKNQPFQNV